MRIEVRNNQVILDGYVNVTDRDSRELPSPKGKFIERVAPRTFQRALDNADDVNLLFNHDKNRKLGSIKEGNLKLREDNVGLRATATVTDEEIIEKAKNGELRGWSFGFRALKDDWEDMSEGLQRRNVRELELEEVSILDKTPAYMATSIEARGRNIMTETRSEEFEATIEDNSEVKKQEKQTEEEYVCENCGAEREKEPTEDCECGYDHVVKKEEYEGSEEDRNKEYSGYEKEIRELKERWS